ncbi:MULTISPECIES: hypothetical protein [unclassified Acinetobacter]|uniref:hypothetical protein n=1 Tax=unclassified Acinetobacter TaxID=196816 RepID=UPI0029346A0F|nr:MULTISPECIES: hypothetical protein [unclassified Acinetobacter]WOE32095.1 hypothetical protein QSG84_02460 [Acinetobacter sp. SAAs470]WOE37564.1 hypothetical protein QSG86_11505 [Acinetobacter sp. SAAs474]
MKKILGLLLTIGLIGCSGNAEQARANLEDQAVLNVKEKLNYPDSAQFRNQKGTCGEVNFKNDKNEFIGFKKYIVVQDMVIIEGDNNSVFEQQWKKHCVNSN